MRYETLILAAILVYPLQVVANESPSCETEYEIPPAVVRQLQKEKGAVLEIREQTAGGYISELFFNRILFRGWFFLKGQELVACEIDFALLLSEEGKVDFIFFREQKEM